MAIESVDPVSTPVVQPIQPAASEEVPVSDVEETPIDEGSVSSTNVDILA